MSERIDLKLEPRQETRFEKHLLECRQCANQPFNLCRIGDHLLLADAWDDVILCATFNLCRIGDHLLRLTPADLAEIQNQKRRYEDERTD